MLIELDPVDRITADAVGAPGERVFYIQARKADRLVTILVEKQQVQLLAASVVEILSRVGKETGEGPSEEAMRLEEPVLPEWRAGRLAIGYQEDRDLVLLEVDELVDEEDEEEEEAEAEEEGLGPALSLGPPMVLPSEIEEENGEDDEPVEGIEDAVVEDGAPPEEPQRARFWATREQMLSLARHGAAVCARGRPRCRLCGNPLDPEGHVCPALNGHRGAAET
jgi:uncharacterized repeat protein (TIGR03847 family)